jgi:hypothetical protein
VFSPQEDAELTETPPVGAPAGWGFVCKGDVRLAAGQSALKPFAQGVKMRER